MCQEISALKNPAAADEGYSITNSTKIIHRYLPQEVSELLVYYLWLVLPFCTQLKLLALNSKELASPYL
jgi:hypothetical protein